MSAFIGGAPGDAAAAPSHGLALEAMVDVRRGCELPIMGVALSPRTPIARREPRKERKAGDPWEAVPYPVHDRCAGPSHANQGAMLVVPVRRDGGVGSGSLHGVFIG